MGPGPLHSSRIDRKVHQILVSERETNKQTDGRTDGQTDRRTDRRNNKSTNPSSAVQLVKIQIRTCIPSRPPLASVSPVLTVSKPGNHIESPLNHSCRVISHRFLINLQPSLHLSKARFTAFIFP